MITPEGRVRHAEIFRRQAESKTELASRIQARKEKTARWRAKYDSWVVQCSTYKSYQKTFSQLIHDEGLNGSLLSFVQSRSEPVVVDFFSFPDAIRSLLSPVKKNSPDTQTTGVSVSISDPRIEKVKRDDTKLGITHMAGDLADINTWKSVGTMLGNKKADLVLERGYAGTSYIPHEKTFFLLTMQQIWNILNPQGGVALIDFSYLGESVSQEEAKQWCEMLRTQGVHAKSSGRALRLTRQEDSPAILPRMKLARAS